ncbi:triacylglycerol lipase [Necator americanus]|uniref:Triacylglycerol lipase n=1 Tax=Necator americanus TaxID=51031 RepID=W2TCU4_NECAM|nr:triacylglycerol lipase [Necator americanus]ETN79016.1 triacylglycerol lipase [Necator americanus]
MHTLLYILLCSNLVLALPFLGKKTNYDEMTARKLLNMAAGAYGDQQQACLNRTFPAHDAHVVVSTTREDCDELDNTCESYIGSGIRRREAAYNRFQRNQNEGTIIDYKYLKQHLAGLRFQGQLLLEGLQSIQPGVDFFDMGSVNRYFMNGHLVLWPQVEQALQDPKYANYKVLFTGHSLGGALAALAAARTAKQGFRRGDQITIYTFGEPRVGDATFAANFDSMIKDSYRVVFRRDIVPHLPACVKDESWFGGGEISRPCDANAKGKPYHHSTEIWYPDSMEHGSHYVECVGEPKGEDFTCSDKIKFHYDQSNSYVWDHRHYFTVKVPSYGKTGCDITQPEGKPGVLEQVVNKLNMCFFTRSPDCEEHKLSLTNHSEVVPAEILNAPPPTTEATSTTSKSSSGFIPFVVSALASIFKGR